MESVELPGPGLKSAIYDEGKSLNFLFDLLYDEMKRVARLHLAREKQRHVVEPTELVHEAYVRLRRDFTNLDKGEFLRAASQVMREILVDHARARLSQKRGCRLQKLPFDEEIIQLPLPPADLLAVHEALDRYALDDPAKAELVQLRIFAGFTLDQAASSLHISRATANRHWAIAKLRLMQIINSTHRES